jgi:guanylate kinase
VTRDSESGYLEVRRRGLMLVLSSPSGAGKTTLSRMLLDRDGGLDMSVSVTTRPKRPGEVSGVDYHFIDASEFNLKVNRRELLERAKVFGHYYGTPKAPVEAALAAGRDVLFDIDWQGAMSIAAVARPDVVRVFILPPSMAELSRRLHHRAQDSEDVIQRRLDRAAGEIRYWPEYDYVLVNEDFDQAYAKLEQIYLAERLRRERNLWIGSFVERLLDEAG